MSKLIVLGSHTADLATFGSAIDGSGKLIGARQFIATKFGVTLAKPAKGDKGLTMKEVKAMLISGKKATEEEIKAASKEYDAARSNFYTQSALFNGQLAADPTLRKSVRLSVSKKTGECIGATTTYRKERGNVNQSLADKVKELTALLAAANERLALPAA